MLLIFGRQQLCRDILRNSSVGFRDSPLSFPSRPRSRLPLSSTLHFISNEPTSHQETTNLQPAGQPPGRRTTNNDRMDWRMGSSMPAGASGTTGCAHHPTPHDLAAPPCVNPRSVSFSVPSAGLVHTDSTLLALRAGLPSVYRCTQFCTVGGY